ncbi:MAG: DUF559 domain-containing protein [Ilumatobacteraceae bacterium]
MTPKDALLLELAAANDFLVGREQVRAAGLTSRQWVHRVGSGEWRVVLPGIWRHSATPETWELRVRAGARWLSSRGAVAGRAAARWWGLDGFECDDSVEFVVPRGRRSKGGPATHTSEDWLRADFLFHRGVQVTTVTRTLLDLAAFGANARELEQAIDSAIRNRWTSIPTLSRRMAAARRGQRGIAVLRELLLDSGGESVLERRFLRLLREARIRRPQTQVAFRRNTSQAIRVDFLFAAEGIVVEVSGRVGHTSDADRLKDARRRNELMQQGLVVLEFTTAHVIGDPTYVLATIRTSLRAAA